MADSSQQSFANHAKFVPLYHYVLVPLLMLFIALRTWQVYRNPGVDTVADLIFVLLIVFVTLFARLFALKAQDRVIRLEETLRMTRLLPADLHARLGELRGRHWVALRFASDDELEDRVREVLADTSVSGKEVKEKVRVWRADHFRV